MGASSFALRSQPASAGPGTSLTFATARRTPRPRSARPHPTLAEERLAGTRVATAGVEIELDADPGPVRKLEVPVLDQRRPSVTSSSKNGTLAACHSSTRKFGIDAQTWAEASVPIGPEMLCGASGRECTSA